ncbi:unnamed protein product [Rotaria sp. Silwood2]|nr:unnamed protein product [Rotaria sp. Silwood2]CAF3052241.1 unnamed protein product [Rotaria sp. Silwood2]CAF4286026.1 unnamed protein product [Rotaria sp. Silwood2]CAF4348329.1 unnamed protein product [Rotaria sp. Silwood2]CAF4381482.1 unnamed protein product [Rotaria sp. Silwood2]
MKTRTKFDLNNTSTAALHFTSCRRKSAKQKQESSISLKSNSLSTSDSFHQYSKLFPIMSELDDLLELEQIKLKQLQLETKISSKIPIFKSSQESNVTDDGNANQWFLHIDAKFSELQLLFQDRIEILSYFFIAETIIWYSLNKNKIRRYTDFCQSFALEYFPKEYSIDCCTSVEQKNNSSSLPSPVVVNEHFVHYPIGGANVKITSSDSKSVLSSTSILTPIISKALIDRFVKDPIKFYGEKDNVITWLDEIEQ